ncbi:GrpB family protein [Niallia circulans]|uniref:GrpB family protein n=1 Tax=Niallia circulans TaxID=1397 RepID=A0A553SH40_NIACI|nr:GrpB family protein [Niallia circulans]TRZ36296.1 GrpB family protein [Niallia circulans]
MRKIAVCTYKEEWRFLFEEEKREIKKIFGHELLEIHHIGSTSITGMKAKPVIDIMPVVKNIHNVEKFYNELAELGYEAKGENGIPGRRYLQKGGDERTHHVHIYERDNKDILRHLAFRDYLRVNKEDATQYGDLKEALAKKYPNNITAYIMGKHELTTALEQKALAWAHCINTSNLKLK